MADWRENLALARKQIDTAEAAALNELGPVAANAAQAASEAAERAELELRRRERG